MWVWAELWVRVQGGQGLLGHLLLTHSFDPAALATLSVGRLDQGVPPIRKSLSSGLGVRFGMARG